MRNPLLLNLPPDTPAWLRRVTAAVQVPAAGCAALAAVLVAAGIGPAIARGGAALVAVAVPLVIGALSVATVTTVRRAVRQAIRTGTWPRPPAD